MKTSSLTKLIALVFGVVPWIGFLSVAQADAPVPVVPPPSYTPLIPPAPVQLFRYRLVWTLFSGLFDPSYRFGAVELRPETDQALQSVWQEIKTLDEDSPELVSQVEALLPRVALMRQEYQAIADPWGELKTLEIALKLHYLACNDGQAVELAETGVSLAKATNNPQAVQEWTEVLAALYWVTGERSTAITLLEASLESRRSPNGGFTYWEAHDLSQLAGLYVTLGRETDAIATYELAVASALIPPRERKLDIYYAGANQLKQSILNSLIALHNLSGNAEQTSYWTQQLAQTELDYGHFDLAYDLLSVRWPFNDAEPVPLADQQTMLMEALQLFRQIGDRWGEMDTLLELSKIALTQANYREAIRLGEEALALAKTYQAPNYHGAIVSTIVDAYKAAGQTTQAEAVQQAYERSAAQLDDSAISSSTFWYGFAANSSLPMLDAAHLQRICLQNYEGDGGGR